VSKLIPLGWRCLSYPTHGNLAIISAIAQIVDRDKGYVGRVMRSLQNAGFVSCHMSSTCTTLGYDAITHIWKIAKLGQQVCGMGPAAYLRVSRTRDQRPPGRARAFGIRFLR
jgi:hypothetical protein